MFLTPFNRRYDIGSYDPFRVFDDMEKTFWGDRSTTTLSTFKTDIRETEDGYVLEADLPGPLPQYPGSQFPGRTHVRIGACPEQEQSRDPREQITV